MEYQPIYGFSGINRQVSRFLPEDGQLAESENFITQKIGVLKKSFDYAIKGSAITSGYDVLGGVDFFRAAGTHEHIVAVNGPSNAKLYKYSGSSWSNQGVNLSTGYKVRFAYSTTIDTLFAVNYQDSPYSHDGSTWSTSTNLSSAPKAKIPFSFGDRIYFFNVNVGGTAYPTRAYRTDQIETAATWTSTNWINFEDVIVGVGLNGENMMVLCQNSTWIFTLADEKYRASDIGCTSHEGVVSRGKFTFYPALQGFMAFDGSDTVKISEAIDEYWRLIPSANFPNICAAIENEHIYVYVGDIPNPDNPDETLQNVVFDYSILQNNWSRGKLADDVKHMHTFVGSDGRKVFMGDNDGTIYQLFSGDGQQNGADYESFIETHWIFGSGANVIDDWRELWGHGKDLSGLKVAYKTEESEKWKSCGELNGDQDFVKFRKKAYKIKFLIKEMSGKNLFELHGLEAGYVPGYTLSEDRTK